MIIIGKSSEKLVRALLNTRDEREPILCLNPLVFEICSSLNIPNVTCLTYPPTRWNAIHEEMFGALSLVKFEGDAAQVWRDLAPSTIRTLQQDYLFMKTLTEELRKKGVEECFLWDDAECEWDGPCYPSLVESVCQMAGILFRIQMEEYV